MQAYPDHLSLNPHDPPPLPCPANRKTEGFSGCEVLRLCGLAAKHAQGAGQQQQPKPRAKWHQDAAAAAAPPPAVTATAPVMAGSEACVTLEDFAAVLGEARPCMSHAAAIAYLKWKTQLGAL